MPDLDPADPPRVVPLTVVDRRRPDPPPEMPEREAALWRAIVNSRRPGWIDNPGSALLLRLYCMAAIIAEDLEQRARRDVHFHGRLIRQTGLILRVAKELGLLPIKPRPPRPKIVRDRPHHTPPWSA
jgi:hypothetical protein